MPTITSIMGFRKILKRISNTTVQSENHIWTTSQCTTDESYRKALQQFIDRRRSSSELVTDAEFYSYQPIKQNSEHLLKKDNNRNCHNNSKRRKYSSFIPGVSHVEASEIFEIGCVAGTEDRYLELISAEWHNTRVSLKRHTHPACQNAIKADIEVLTEIRHPNVLLLMATTHTDEHGLVSIFESVNCTLYNFIHEQGERMSIQNVAQIGMKLADALKYCHMRGYIHGAISSHCVYLVPNGGIKLGGWELTTLENDDVQRNYEKCLRMEIFKWQAPEFFYGLRFSTRSDIYGLSLLLWEISTARIPWSGCNRPHVEMQYTTRKRGIIVDFNNFPLCLQKLLENGLQLDAAKRTFDMDKIRKTLHRLLMSEEAEATCVNECGILKLERNNNIKNIQTSTPKVSYENVMLIRRSPTNRSDNMTQEKLTNRSFTSTMVQCNRDLDENNVKKKNVFLTDNGTKRLATEVQTTNYNTCMKHLNMKHLNMKELEIDEKLHNTTRSEIKRLKEINASRREHFFNESNSSFTSSTSNPTRSNKNTDYVLCKPASHATNMELKYRKSPGEYEGNITKPSHTMKQKTMYANIKDAIAQRQVLHPDVGSFYESILWRKEKLICLSRMGRENNNICQRSWPLLPKPFTGVNSNTGNGEMHYPKLGSIKSSGTFTVKDAFEKRVDKRTNNAKTSLLKHMQSNSTSIKALNFSDNPLQNLKDAIDRATEIVRSGTQYDNSIPYSQNYYNSEAKIDSTEKYESAFEDLHETKYDDDNQEINVIEKSSGLSLLEDYMTAESSIEMENRGKVVCDFVNYNMQDATHTNKLICETIEEVDSNGSQTSMQNQQLGDLQKTNRDGGIYTNSASTPHKADLANFKTVPTKSIDVNTLLLRPNNIIRCEVCNSYDLNDLRRRSLPACLNNLKLTQSPGIRKTHTHKSCIQGSNCTIEDLYIDDEFGSRLNDNLVLLNDGLQSSSAIDDYSYDHQNLPQTTEL